MPRPVPDAQTEERRALLARRRQFIAMRTAEHNRPEHAPHRLRTDIEAHIAWLDQRVAALDTTWTRRCGRVLFGASARPCTAVSLALGRYARGR